ncbi:YOR207Cp-like protein, partial [Caulochytrium protostelioides]
MRYHGKKLSDPINTADDKWRLLPAFLQTRGLIKQHIDSFNYFCEVDIKNIMRASREVRSDVDPTFFLRFRDIRVQKPAVTDHHTAVGYELTPHECRLRDVTYAGSIFVDIEYVRGKTLVRQSNIEIARMPIMLKSSRCILTGKAPAEVAAAGECPLDPGGYFIIRGTEKVILIQEQLSKNRIIVETDRVGCITANVTSSTHEKKSKTYVAITKTGRAVVRHNSFQTEVPLPVVLKAMGIESDRGIAELVCGYNKDYLDLFAPTLEGAAGGNTSGDGVMVRTQQEALEWLSGRIRIPMRFGGPPKDRIEEVKDLLATTLLAHIPIEMHHGVPSYQAKAVYLGVMTRRCLQAIKNGGLVDDRDFVGNKRLELAGQLLSLLFEDLFRSWCSTLKRAVDMGLKKTQR